MSEFEESPGHRRDTDQTNMPVLLPRLGEFLRAVSPYVQGVKLGAVQVDFRDVRREAITVPSSGALAAVPNDVAALSSGTAISEVVSSLRRLRREGGSPVAVIDLRDGQKWRLPNLYFVARLLELEPLVSELVFTEMRDDVDGYLLGTCRPDEFRRQVERTLPAYADASGSLTFSAERDVSDPAQAQELGTMFQSLLNSLPTSPAPVEDPLRGYVSSEMVTKIVSGLLSGVAIESTTTTLADEQLRTVLESPHRFIPLKAGGRLNGLIDRDAVALSVARSGVAG